MANVNTFAVVPDELSSILTASDASDAASSSSSRGGHRFLRLPHPRTDEPCLYLPQPATGTSPSQILEVQTIAPNAERSWFFGQNVISDGRLLTLTPVDPIFLLIPLLRAVFPPGTEDASIFRTSSDIFEEASARLTGSSYPSLSQLAPSQTHMDSPVKKKEEKGKGREDRPITSEDILEFGALDCVQDALRRICDVQEFDAETIVFRPSVTLLHELVRFKIERLASPETFNAFASLQRVLARAGLTDDTSGLEAEKKEELARLARLKASADILAQYIPPSEQEAIIAPYDFTPLSAHLATLEPPDAPPPTTEETAGKKKPAAKVGAGGKKGKNTNGPSRAVEKLKKADTKGMNKLSSFFGKK